MHAFLLVTDQKSPKFLDKFPHKIYYPIPNIAQVRQLTKDLTFTPVNETAYILTEIESAKDEAQNALLKILEEPPKNVVFVIVANNANSILSTILSRVSVVKEKGDNKKNEVSDKPSFLEISKITDRQAAKEYVSHFFESKGLEIKEAALTAFDALNKNGNVALQLTNFVTSALKHTPKQATMRS